VLVWRYRCLDSNRFIDLNELLEDLWEPFCVTVETSQNRSFDATHHHVIHLRKQIEFNPEVELTAKDRKFAINQLALDGDLRKVIMVERGFEDYAMKLKKENDVKDN
jgi:hypothetical protein